MLKAIVFVPIALSALAVAPAAIGEGDDVRETSSAGAVQSFSVSVENEARRASGYHVFALGADNEETPGQIVLRPVAPYLGPGESANVTVAVAGLAPGQSREFRVCSVAADMRQSLGARHCTRFRANRT